MPTVKSGKLFDSEFIYYPECPFASHTSYGVIGDPECCHPDKSRFLQRMCCGTFHKVGNKDRVLHCPMDVKK